MGKIIENKKVSAKYAHDASKNLWRFIDKHKLHILSAASQEDPKIVNLQKMQ